MSSGAAKEAQEAKEARRPRSRRRSIVKEARNTGLLAAGLIIQDVLEESKIRLQRSR